MPVIPPFAIALLALITGTIVGWFVQRTMSSIQNNGAWADFPAWKKRSLSMRGSIAALIAGLYVLQGAEAFSAWGVIWKMWLAQTAAAYAGAPGLDLIVKILGRIRND